MFNKLFCEYTSGISLKLLKRKYTYLMYFLTDTEKLCFHFKTLVHRCSLTGSIRLYYERQNVRYRLAKSVREVQGKGRDSLLEVIPRNRLY